MGVFRVVVQKRDVAVPGGISGQSPDGFPVFFRFGVVEDVDGGDVGQHQVNASGTVHVGDMLFFR